MKSWNDCLQAVTQAHLELLASARGISVDFFTWLHDLGFLGMWNDSPAFPIHCQGNVVGCHIRFPDGWRVESFNGERTFSSLVFGNPQTAEWCFCFESQWDAFAVMSQYPWEQSSTPYERGCIIITRGASRGKAIANSLLHTCRLYAFLQNDQPGTNGSLSPAEKWFKDVGCHAGCSVFRVSIPSEHKDANDWLRAGARPQDFGKVVSEAVPMPPPLPEENKGIRTNIPDWVELGLSTEVEFHRQLFPTHTIPSPYAEMVRCVAVNNRVPEALPATIALAAISFAVGRGLAARIFQDKVTPANIYALAAVPTGGGKTTSSDPLMKPFVDIDGQMKEVWRAQVWPGAKARRDFLKKEIELIHRQLKRSATQEDRETLIAQAAEKEVAIHDAELRLIEPALIAEDVTTEVLAVIMGQQQESMALLSTDGGDVIANIAGKYRKKESVDDNLYVKGYSGDAVRVNRINRPSIFLKAPCLSILLLVQPDKLLFLLSKRALIEGGLMPRFLITRLDVKPSHVTVDVAQLPPDTLASYSSGIETLVRFFRMNKDVVIVPTSLAAKQVIVDYYNHIADRRGDDLKDVSGFAARWHEQASRLAVVLHAAKHGPEAARLEIQEDTARAGVEMAEWFAAEQLAILESSRGQGLEQTLTAIWRYASITPDGFTSRNLQRNGLVEDAQEAESILARMVEVDVLTCERTETGGRPTTTYRLNRSI
jgi:hypothetical protein